MMFVEGKWIKNSRIAWAKENNKSIFDCERPKKHEIVKVKNKNGVVEERELMYIGSQMAQGVVDEMKSNLKTIIKLTKSKKQKKREKNLAFNYHNGILYIRNHKLDNNHVLTLFGVLFCFGQNLL